MNRGTPILLGFLLFAPAAAPLSASESPADDKKILIRDGEVVRLDDAGDEPLLLQADGRSRRAFIGVRPVEMTPDLRAHYGAPREAGVLVGEVEQGGPAAKGGLQVGDVLTAVDGEKIDSGADLSRAVRRKKDGETIKLEILRDKSKKTLSIAVAERQRTEIAWTDIRPRLRERSFSIPMQEFEFHAPRAPRRLDLDRMSERLEQLEKRLKDLEKKVSR